MWDCGTQGGTFYRKIPRFLLGGIGKSHITKIHIVSTEPSLHHPTHSGFAVTLHDPYESIAGGQCLGSRSLRLIPLFGAPKWHQSIN